MPRIEPRDTALKDLKGLHLWHAPMSSCSQRVRIALTEAGRDWESHVVNLEKDEHATPEYQAIHPDGLVPALIEDGALWIESVDIIALVAGDALPAGDPDLLARADAAQRDLKLLSFEYLFRAKPPPPAEAAAAFQRTHENAWLRQFRLDFAKGFPPERLHAAIARTKNAFDHLDGVLADGRTFLGGEEFSLSDVAWMPNFHRFDLMGWPFQTTPRLAKWFDRVKARESYARGLLDWEPQGALPAFAAYVAKRQAEGTDIGSAPVFREGD